MEHPEEPPEPETDTHSMGIRALIGLTAVMVTIVMGRRFIGVPIDALDWELTLLGCGVAWVAWRLR